MMGGVSEREMRVCEEVQALQGDERLRSGMGAPLGG